MANKFWREVEGPVFAWLCLICLVVTVILGCIPPPTPPKSGVPPVPYDYKQLSKEPAFDNSGVEIIEMSNGQLVAFMQRDNLVKWLKSNKDKVDIVSISDMSVESSGNSTSVVIVYRDLKPSVFTEK